MLRRGSCAVHPGADCTRSSRAHHPERKHRRRAEQGPVIRAISASTRASASAFRVRPKRARRVLTAKSTQYVGGDRRRMRRAIRTGTQIFVALAFASFVLLVFGVVALGTT